MVESPKKATGDTGKLENFGMSIGEIVAASRTGQLQTLIAARARAERPASSGRESVGSETTTVHLGAVEDDSGGVGRVVTVAGSSSRKRRADESLERPVTPHEPGAGGPTPPETRESKRRRFFWQSP